MWARQSNHDGSFQTSLRYQQISYAELAPSFLRPETFLFPHTVLPVNLRSIHFSPWISFGHTALCGGEVQRCTFWEPLLGFSLFFSMTSYLSHILFFIFIHIYIRYHHIPSRSSICYKEDQFFFSFLEGDSLFLNYLGNPTLHLFHLPLFLTITMHNGINKMHWCYLCLAQWCWFFPRIMLFLYIAALCSSQSPHSQILAHNLFLIFWSQLITTCDLTESYALVFGAFNFVCLFVLIILILFLQLYQSSSHF